MQTNSLRRMTAARFLMKLVVCMFALVAWFAAAQHCALGTVSYLVAEASGHGCCHESHAMPMGEKGECCDALAAPLSSSLPVQMPVLLAVFSAWTEILLLPLPSVSESGGDWQQDVGPPSTERQLLLSRLSAAHAPPLGLA